MLLPKGSRGCVAKSCNAVILGLEVVKLLLPGNAYQQVVQTFAFGGRGLFKGTVRAPRQS